MPPSLKKSLSLNSHGSTDSVKKKKHDGNDGQMLMTSSFYHQNYTEFTSPRILRKEMNGPEMITDPDQINRGLTRDFLTLAYYNAIATGQIGLLKAVYKTGKAPQVDKQGNTPLHIAARCGQLRSLRWLLVYSSTPIYAKNGRGETPLHVAGLHGNLKCLEALIASEKDNVINILCDRDNMGMTVLHHATIGNRDTTVSWLAEQFGPDLCLVKSVDGVLAIHLASAAGNIFCTHVLAEVCIQTVHIRDMFGATAAFYAAQEGHLPCLEYLVEEAGSNLGLVACEGMTAVLTASEGGHLEALKYIIYKQGHGVLLESTNDGATVFHYAAGNGHYEILQYLLEEVPDTSNILRLCDINDRCPAHDAAENGYVDCLKLIIDAGMSIFQPDKDGDTPLSLALKSRNPNCALYAKTVSETTMDKSTFKQMKKMMASNSPQFSNIVTIQAMSNQNTKTAADWNGTMTDDMKKKMVSSMDNVDNDCISLKSEGIYMWPNWKRSVSSRRPNRTSNRGIFRGEFILLRSSPPGTVSIKNRKTASLNRNGHLYAQRNRPCPISLPLQTHEYPTRINQMYGEDEFNTDDIERMFKQPLDVIPEYGNIETKQELYQVEEEKTIRESCHQEVKHPQRNSKQFNNFATLGKQFGLKEAQTSFSVFGKRPYKKNSSFSSLAPVEDYSSDESGISTESGSPSHSDNEDKHAYSLSSSDESGTSKRFSDSCDSAVKDSYCISSDEEDMSPNKRELFVSPKEGLTNAPNIEKRLMEDKQSTTKDATSNRKHIDLDELSKGTSLLNKTLAKPTKAGKRPLRNIQRKRNGTLSSSDEEGFSSISSSSFTCLNSNRNISKPFSKDSSLEKDERRKSSLIRRESLASQTESLASVLQKSMTGCSDLKTTLRCNSMKDNTCKTVFNSASLSREMRKKPSTRQERDLKLPASRKCLSFCIDKDPSKSKNQDSDNMFDSGAYSSTDEKIPYLSTTPASCTSDDRFVASRSEHLSDDSQSPAHLSKTIYDSNNEAKEETPTSISPTSSSDEENLKRCKATSKIKALQNVLMKQSLPFANKFGLQKVNKRNESVQSNNVECNIVAERDVIKNKDANDEPIKIQLHEMDVEKSKLITKVNNVTSGSKCLPPIPPPPPPPPPSPPSPSSSTLPKIRKTSQITKCVSYATTTKVETRKDDCQLDDATKTRIASIKSMLERASTVDDSVLTMNDKQNQMHHHDST